MVRNSVAFVPWQQRKQVCADLKAIYSATTESEAEFNLELFAEKWDKQYPSISKSWRCGIFLRSGRGSIRDCKPALNRFAILFEDRLLI